MHDPSMVSDDDLLCAAGRGDEAAFASLTRRHAARARTLAFRQLGNMADAEDVMQEAFWRVWKHAATWRRGEAAFTTWLHRIVINACIDRERRMKWRRWLPFGDVPEPPSENLSVEEELESRGELRQVLNDIKELPARQRAAVLLSAEGNRSNKEMAEMLEISEKALESLLVRGRRTLRLRAQERQLGWGQIPPAERLNERGSK